jgi:hypothetical protein
MENSEIYALSTYVRYYCPNNDKEYKKSVSILEGTESERNSYDGEWSDYGYSYCYVNCACGQTHKIII